MFLCEIRTRHESARNRVLEKYSSRQGVLIFCYFYVHFLYLVDIQVYKAIFTSPSSAKDVLDGEDNDENAPPAKSQRTLSGNKPVRRHVASMLHLNNKVTPRSIAYAAVQVNSFYYSPFYTDLRLASYISTCKLQVHGPQFTQDLTTGDCSIISSMSSKIPLGLLRRSDPKIYLTGGQRQYSLFLQKTFN